MMQESGRRLAAIMFTDVVGYSRMAGRDESLAMQLLNEHRDLVRRMVGLHGGKEIKTTGDGFLLEFASIVEAVHCAVAIQTAFFERNLSVEEEKKLQIRIGLHVGDVLDLEEDRLGNEVNIAARIEPFAGPGGICVSQSVKDQVSGKIDLPIIKLGRIRLKNIRDPVTVHRIELPWERGRSWLGGLFGKRFRGNPALSPQAGLLGLQIAAILALLVFVLLQTRHPVTFKIDRGPIRSIASVSAEEGSPSGGRELALPSGWQYAHGTDELPGTQWYSFDPSKTIRYANEIQGSYLLRLSFIGEGGFRHPAMVLGLVPDVSRVYLNGKFIGGSERYAELPMYSFDPSLIKPGEANTILIKAWTRRTLSPGMNVLPSVTPRIGEFEDISREVMSNRISFQVLRPVYLVVSLLIALAGLMVCLVRRGDLKYLYFSGFLLLGSLALAYYNPFVASALDYDFYRYIKLISFALSSFFLFSSYLHVRELRRLETLNNLAGIGFAASAAFLLLNGRILPGRYILSFDGLATAAVIYGCVWLGLLALRAALKLSRPLELRSASPARMVEAGMIFVFGVVVTLLCLSSGLGSEGGLAAAEWVRGLGFQQVAIAYPFVFAIVILATGLADYTRKSRSFAYKKKKDDLILSIADLVSSCPDVVQAVTQIQSRLADFLSASRSTIYLAAGEQEDKFLKASFVHGPVGIKERVEKVIPPRSGIIGYCLETRSAVFVEDIARDPRFGKRKPEGYRTGSCMIFPLVLGSRLLGVITVADRLDNRPFTREDFCLMHLVAKDLAFVISHSRFRESAAEAA